MASFTERTATSGPVCDGVHDDLAAAAPPCLSQVGRRSRDTTSKSATAEPSGSYAAEDRIVLRPLAADRERNSIILDASRSSIRVMGRSKSMIATSTSDRTHVVTLLACVIADRRTPDRSHRHGVGLGSARRAISGNKSTASRPGVSIAGRRHGNDLASAPGPITGYDQTIRGIRFMGRRSSPTPRPSPKRRAEPHGDNDVEQHGRMSIASTATGR